MIAQHLRCILGVISSCLSDRICLSSTWNLRFCRLLVPTTLDPLDAECFPFSVNLSRLRTLFWDFCFNWTETAIPLESHVSIGTVYPKYHWSLDYFFWIKPLWTAKPCRRQIWFLTATQSIRIV